MKKQKILIDVPKRVNILNVPISTVNLTVALNFVANNFNAILGNYICASNVHTTVMAYENNEYLKVQSESILSLPDGKPLAVVGRKKGYKEMKKTTGTHFMQSIFIDDRFKNKKHYFYGNTKENLDLMINKIKKDYPNLNICGYEPSIFRELTDSEVNDLALRINETGAGFVWIGIGAPRQEILMNRLKGKTTSIMIGVGGVFNILAGLVNDAPKWMQDMGLEWFYRLIKDPKRLFKRYFVTNFKFIYYLLKEKVL